jgi:hypothetical protein
MPDQQEGGHQQVDMIGHEHPSVDTHAESHRRFKQLICVGLEVGIRGQAELPIIASLDDMNRQSRRTLSGQARHGCRLVPDSRTPRRKSKQGHVNFYSDPKCSVPRVALGWRPVVAQSGPEGDPQTEGSGASWTKVRLPADSPFLPAQTAILA